MNLLKFISVNCLLSLCLNTAAKPKEVKADEVNLSTLYVSAASGLNYRSSPEILEDNIIKTFHYGEELTVIESEDYIDWALVITEEDEFGWCYNEFLTEDKPKDKGKYLGEFTITTYTPDPKENAGSSKNCYGESLYNWIGTTVAVDKNVIPLKSWIYIEGIGKRQARDTGVKGKHIDVLCASNGGKAKRKVWLLEE